MGLQFDAVAVIVSLRILVIVLSKLGLINRKSSWLTTIMLLLTFVAMGDITCGSVRCCIGAIFRWCFSSSNLSEGSQGTRTPSSGYGSPWGSVVNIGHTLAKGAEEFELAPSFEGTNFFLDKNHKLK